MSHPAGLTGLAIGIEDPADPSRAVTVVPVRNGAVATSGEAHRGQHIIPGRTGVVPSAVASVTVIADNLTWADTGATPPTPMTTTPMTTTR